MPFVYRVEDADPDSRHRYFTERYRYRRADNRFDKYTPFHVTPTETSAIYGVWCFRDIVGAIAEQQRPGMRYFISRVDTAAFNNHFECRDPAVADNADPSCHSAWVYYRVLTPAIALARPELPDRFVSIFIDSAWYPKCERTGDFLASYYRDGKLSALKPTVGAISAPLNQPPAASPQCAPAKTPDPGLLTATFDQVRSWFRR